jgi:YbgC/YbaW family acyl-CoA thioester hydrolase
VVRTYTWHYRVRNFEGDAFRQLQPSGMLRLCEQSAVDAAGDVGYDKNFHSEHGTAWVIRRMTLVLGTPARIEDELEITTWISHFAKVRGGREYRIKNLTTGLSAAEGLAEWVYLDRQKLTPRVIPAQTAIDFDVPGAPLGDYTAPAVEPLPNPMEFTVERTAEWYETDSMEHINNAVYSDWLDSGFRSAVTELGWTPLTLREAGYQLRAEHMYLDYKRPALPGDRLTISTRLVGIEERLCAVQQTITRPSDGVDLLSADMIYGWADPTGSPVQPPEGWLAVTKDERRNT